MSRAALEKMVRDPQIEINKLESDKIEFVLSNTDTSVANAIRRVMISEVKTMCIERVEVHQNTSMLTDEFLAHRLGLIPLTYTYNQDYLNYCAGPDKDMLGTLGHRFMDNRDCECGGECYRCCVTFELKVKFDHDELPGQVQKLVTSKDLKPYMGEGGQDFSDVLPCHFSNAQDRDQAQDEGILIVKLARGQEIHMRCIAILGIGKQHAKWSPVSVCSFICEPVITLNKPKLDLLSNEERKTIRDACPVGVFGESYLNVDDQPLVVKHLEKCMYCAECELRCVDISGKVDHDLLAVTRNDKKFIFSVETTGALPPEDVVQQALQVIQNKLIKLQGEVSDKIVEEEQTRFDHADTFGGGGF